MADACAICHSAWLPDQEKIFLSCAHGFHAECISGYAASQGQRVDELRCPECRMTSAQRLELTAALEAQERSMRMLPPLHVDGVIQVEEDTAVEAVIEAAPSLRRTRVLGAVLRRAAVLQRLGGRAARKRVALAKAKAKAAAKTKAAAKAKPKAKANAKTKANAKAKAKAVAAPLTADAAPPAAEAAPAAPALADPAIGQVSCFYTGLIHISTSSRKRNRNEIKRSRSVCRNHEIVQPSIHVHQVATGSFMTIEEPRDRCGNCDQVLPFAKLRLRAKASYRCLFCSGRITALRRAKGGWPTKGFTDLTQDQQTEFMRNCPSKKKDVLAHYSSTMSRHESHEVYYSEGGQFLPLGAWAAKGFSADAISEKTPAEDRRVHPVLGDTFRVAILEKGERGAKGHASHEQLGVTVKKRSAAALLALLSEQGITPASSSVGDANKKEEDDNSDEDSASDGSDSSSSVKKNKKRKDKKNKKKQKKEKKRKDKEKKDKKTADEAKRAGEAATKAAAKQKAASQKLATDALVKVSAALVELSSALSKPLVHQLPSAIIDPARSALEEGTAMQTACKQTLQRGCPLPFSSSKDRACLIYLFVVAPSSAGRSICYLTNAMLAIASHALCHILPMTLHAFHRMNQPGSLLAVLQDEEVPGLGKRPGGEVR
jgi:hypothetical protein